MTNVSLRMLMRPVLASVVLISVAHAETPAPAVDLLQELRAIGTKATPKARVDFTPVVGRGCAAPTKAERAALQKRVLAWIDSQHPDESASPGGTDATGIELVFHAGCKDASGIVAVDVGQDRVGKKTQDTATRRNYILRVGADAIEIVAETTSTPSMNWMEWADEGRLELVAQVDLDGDGALDLVWSETDHEGGSMTSDAHLQVRPATGKPAPIATITNLADAQLVSGRLVIAGQDRDAHARYGCIGKNLRVGTCAAAAALQKAADRREIAARYANLSAGEVPDRELLADELATLGIKGKAALVAAAPETTPVQRAQRKVTRFLAKAGLQDELQPLVTQPHADARAFLDGLATKLGDQACTSAPLADADRAKIGDWVKRQDSKPAEVEIASAPCGPYAWAAWTPQGDNRRREVLLALDGMSRILGFTYENEGGPGWVAFMHTDAFFAHDGTIVGIALHDQSLWVVVGGKVVAQSKGDVALYHHDRRWSETAIDLVVDGGTVWHATPTGRDKLDPQLVRDHETQRAALERVVDNAASSDPAYLAALRTLGADAALIATCKALPR